MIEQILQTKTSKNNPSVKLNNSKEDRLKQDNLMNIKTKLYYNQDSFVCDEKTFAPQTIKAQLCQCKLNQIFPNKDHCSNKECLFQNQTVFQKEKNIFNIENTQNKQANESKTINELTNATTINHNYLQISNNETKEEEEIKLNFTNEKGTLVISEINSQDESFGFYNKQSFSEVSSEIIDHLQPNSLCSSSPYDFTYKIRDVYLPFPLFQMKFLSDANPLLVIHFEITNNTDTLWKQTWNIKHKQESKIFPFDLSLQEDVPIGELCKFDLFFHKKLNPYLIYDNTINRDTISYLIFGLLNSVKKRMMVTLKIGFTVKE